MSKSLQDRSNRKITKQPFSNKQYNLIGLLVIIILIVNYIKIDFFKNIILNIVAEITIYSISNVVFPFNMFP